MENGPIDWEAMMTQTLTAAKAASRGSERVAAAISAMVEQQQENSISLKRNQDTLAQILESVLAIQTAQESLTKGIRHLATQKGRHRQKHNSHPALLFVGIGFVACAALSAIW